MVTGANKREISLEIDTTAACSYQLQVDRSLMRRIDAVISDWCSWTLDLMCRMIYFFCSWTLRMNKSVACYFLCALRVLRRCLQVWIQKLVKISVGFFLFYSIWSLLRTFNWINSILTVVLINLKNFACQIPSHSLIPPVKIANKISTRLNPPIFYGSVWVESWVERVELEKSSQKRRNPN